MPDTPMTVPVVSIVGKGDSGKTTFLEKLIRELSSRGVRVATVKHHVHDYDIDVPGKDSWRHARAGAVTTMVSSPDKFSLITRVEHEHALPELARIAADSGAQLLLTEGYKQEATTRIEIARAARSDSLISSPDDLVALVTDKPELGPEGVPVYGLEDAPGVADLICFRYLPGVGVVGGVARSFAGEQPKANASRECLSTTPPTTPTPDPGEL